MQFKKILIIRFSSIGDIVLTTPIIRCIKSQLKGTEVHFVTKKKFESVLTNNSNIDKLHTFEHDVSELFTILQNENYDVVIDLHKNLRSWRLKRKLKAKAYSFNKLNFEKFIAVVFKKITILPKKHIVDRYFDAVRKIGIIPDEKGLDYFISKNDEIDILQLLENNLQKKYIALVVGGSYNTKKIPLNKLKEICNLINLTIITLGGPEDKLIADELKTYYPTIINGCGNFSLNQSASIIKQAEWIITSDTGLMHIASAFDKKIISIWGNTIPEFGMDPYKPNIENKILQVENLKCRPCSKLGFKNCPKKHFKCMNDVGVNVISKIIIDHS